MPQAEAYKVQRQQAQDVLDATLGYQSWRDCRVKGLQRWSHDAAVVRPLLPTSRDTAIDLVCQSAAGLRIYTAMRPVCWREGLTKSTPQRKASP
jgi:hypothetical protein